MVISKDQLWETGHDETVEVNQRALIDKVLARYSGEFTVFRELLQNSDDAQSTTVEIIFETKGYLDKSRVDRNEESIAGDNGPKDQLPDLKTEHVHQWTFKNNGISFRDEDWSRLKKIAEGNPDEEKIGAFGVGFYSLFSVTEEPFVASGSQWMGFYWKDKKDQLFARRGIFPDADEDENAKRWTSFTMTLRESAPIPIAFDFTRFLASSLTFMRHLREVSVYFDDKRLVKLLKVSGMPQDLTMPKGLKNRSPSGIMVVDGIQSTSLYIQAQVMKWIYTSGTEKKKTNPLKVNKPLVSSGGGFFSSLFSSLSATPTTQHSLLPPPPSPRTKSIDHLAINETSVSLSIYSASIQVRLDKKLSYELQRSTKKNPPAKMRFELIYTAKDEYDLSLEEEAKQPEATGSIFQGLRADLDGANAARVFIGHSTAQSTGIGGHISARFIPTVEREAIDFMDRNIAVWNKELLYIGGFLSRAAYEFEMSTVKKLWAASLSRLDSPPQDVKDKLTSRVLHALKFFMFSPSTPSVEVSHLMETAFFECSMNGQFPIMSSRGVLDIAAVRLPDPTFSLFLKELPVLPDSIIADAPAIIACLQNRGMVTSINFQDVLRELQHRPLTEEEFVACLNWWASVFREREGERLLPIRSQLIGSVVLSLKQNGEEKIIPLSSVKAFFNPRTLSGSIPLDGPLPDYLLPVLISKRFKPEVLSSSFPWSEFSIIQWITFLCEANNLPAEYDISLSPEWSEKVFSVLSRAWPTVSASVKSEIIRLMSVKACIPTSAGMIVPHQAYFPNVNIFGDLPVVVWSSGMVTKGSIEKVLQDLGVRRHVELQIIFTRMIKTNEWTIADLIKYLVSVKGSLTPDEFQRLKLTPAFPAEATKEPSENGKRPRFKANQLYEPLEIFRSLKLPIIDWGQHTKWRSSSDEAKFLFELGLLRQPPLNKLIELCAHEDNKIRSAALKYLIDNVDTRYKDFDLMDYKEVKFIPALNNAKSCLGAIQEVFSLQWAAMGFLVLDPAIQPHASKLRLKEHPNTHQLIGLLQSKPPKNKMEAGSIFALLASRVNDFKNSDLQVLSVMPFVPIVSEPGAAGPSMRWLPPSQCYLRGQDHASFHSKLFVFVDFGSAANAFLLACGTRSQPSVEEVAKILLANPRHFYELAQGPTSFISELRNLAVNYNGLSSGTLARMKKTPILLGLQRKTRRTNNAGDDWDEDDWEIAYDLKKPIEIFVADETHAYQAFGGSLFTAPQEDIIEAFYCNLGSPRLSRIVREEYQTSVELANSKVAAEVRTLILERLPLFLHEHHHARTKVSFSWFSTNKNFVVRAYGKLNVTKSLTYGTLNLSRKQDASAVSQRIGSGPVELWIAGNAQLDMYEVATSLNRLLFEAPKANDALLFMTILSTDLRSLKRRGYNVDRILRQQKEARLAAERAAEKPPPTLPPPVATPPDSLPSEKSSMTNDEITSTFKPEEKQTTTSQIATQIQNWKRKLGGITPDKNPPTGKIAESPSAETLLPDRPKLPLMPSPNPPSPSPGQGVTPLSNIARNINMAIDSCKSESSGLLQNREHMQRVQESVNDGYCDISGRKGALHNIGQMGPVKVYLSEEVPSNHAGTFMETKRQSLARFIHIIKPLADIYSLPLGNLHIFYDLEGGIIAFNRNGSIFLNLRYFEEWHDGDVKNDKLDAAYISWYFTIAHEIAHNLVQPHNSEHEFYFSAICEKFITRLGLLFKH